MNLLIKFIKKKKKLKKKLKLINENLIKYLSIFSLHHFVMYLLVTKGNQRNQRKLRNRQNRRKVHLLKIFINYF
jgi:hypothetical protein